MNFLDYLEGFFFSVHFFLKNGMYFNSKVDLSIDFGRCYKHMSNILKV